MYCAPASQSYSRKQILRSRLIKAWLLGLLCIFGCSQGSQVREDNNINSSTKVRPLDVDTSTAEKIGQETLEIFSYDEIIKLSEKAGFVEEKLNVGIQLASYGPAITTGFVRVFSRYALAAGVTSQADSPLPGPADIAAVGVIVIGLVDAGLLDGYLLNTLGAWLFSKAKTDQEGRGRGANRADGRMVDDVARHAGVSDRAGFGKFIEAEKRASGRGGADNFTWDELLDLADQFKAAR